MSKKLFQGLASLLAGAGALFLLGCPAPSFSATRAVMEGTYASNSAILVDTVTARVLSGAGGFYVTGTPASAAGGVHTGIAGIIFADGSTLTSAQNLAGVVGTTTTIIQTFAAGVLVSSPTLVQKFSTNFAGTLTGGATVNIDLANTVTVSNLKAGNTFGSWPSSNTITSSGNDNSILLSISAGDTTNNPRAVVLTSTGTGVPLTIASRGVVSGGYQNQKGALTITDTNNPTGPPSTLLVLVSSTTDAQLGGGVFEMWINNPNFNDPYFWIHSVANNSAPFIRADMPAPNMEWVGSSDTAHGLSKWEQAIAFQGVDFQVNSRAWDNTTFENNAYFHPLSKWDAIPGLYFRSQTLANDSAVLTSSDTSAVTFYTVNNHTVGLTGPLNTTNSYTFGLPSTVGSQGQILYHNGNRGNNFNVRQMEWTTGGSVNQALTYQGTAAPTWQKVILSTETLQAGTTFFVSSGTVTNLTVTSNVNTYRLTLTQNGDGVLDSAGNVIFKENSTGYGFGSNVIGSNYSVAAGVGITAASFPADYNVVIGGLATGTPSSVVIGYNAFSGAQSGNTNNVIIGNSALPISNTTPSNANQHIVAIGANTQTFAGFGQSVTGLTLIGDGSKNVNTGTSSNATAIGYGASVSQSNSIVLGSTNPATNVGIGTTAPSYLLDVNGAGRFVSTLYANSGIIIPANGPSLTFLKSGGGAGASIYNNDGVNNAQVGIYADGGIGINTNNPYSGAANRPTVFITGGASQPWGSFAVRGSSNDATTTYSGFTSTNAVDQSMLWVIPKKDGTSGAPMVTDGSGNLSFYPNFLQIASQTKAQLAVTTPSKVGQIVFCSDCSTDGVCVSTGTAAAAYGRISARTTACQ